MIVTDSSALYEALLRPGPARRRMHGEVVCVPHLVDIEVTSILRKVSYKGDISLDKAIAVIGILITMDIYRYHHTPFVPRLWELRHNLAPYDASYVALAESLQVPLVTVDTKLTRVPDLPVVVELIPRSMEGTGARGVR